MKTLLAITAALLTAGTGNAAYIQYDIVAAGYGDFIQNYTGFSLPGGEIYSYRFILPLDGETRFYLNPVYYGTYYDQAIGEFDATFSGRALSIHVNEYDAQQDYIDLRFKKDPLQGGLTTTDLLYTHFQTVFSGPVGPTYGIPYSEGYVMSLTSTVIDNPGGYAPRGEITSSGPFLVPVPEPATWSTMIAGLGLIGAGLRSRQRAVVRFA